MPEALVRIKKDLGPEAVIISSYRVPAKGLKGLFVRQLEVTAALDDQRENKYFGRVGASGRLVDQAGRHLPGDTLPPAPGVTAGPRGGGPETGWWNLVPRLVRSLPGGGPEDHRPVPSAGPANKWRRHLAALQLSEDLVELVLDGVQAGPEDYLRCRLEQRLAGWCQRYCAGGSDSRVVVLTGPSGTGKTTSLIKLAAGDVLFREEKVAIVSLTGSQRSGGDSALRHWARLLDVPFAVAGDPEELSRVLAGWGGVERFYLDTPADPFYRAGKLLELAGFLSQVRDPEVLLVLSATTRDGDLMRAVAQVSRFAVSGLVLTKVDEASSLGPVLSLLPRLARPLAYLGSGREVPDDLQPAGGALLASLLLGGAGCDGESAGGLLAAR
jgi:flagellar biosynthesis protein FlhF